MTGKIDTQKIIDRIKVVRNLPSDKEVAILLDLTPADFSNRKKRDTLTSLIVEWAVAENLDLNDLFKGGESEEDRHKSVEGKNIYAMVNGKTSESWLSDQPVEKMTLSEEYVQNVELVKMNGISMEPTIHDGAVFAVDCRVRSFSSGQIFLIRMPIDGPVVRRAFIDIEKLTLKSDNKAYPDIFIPLDELPEDGFVLGRVMWTLQWM